MWTRKNSIILGTTLLLCLINIGLGYVASSALLVIGGGIGIGYVWARVVCGRRGCRTKAALEQSAAAAPAPHVPKATARGPVDPADTDQLVEQMLGQGRFALLLRAQIVDNLSEAHFCCALKALEQAMALVPDGEVVLGRIDEALEDGKLDDEEILSCQGRVIWVEQFFLDRYPVTNRQFYEFVAGGGYEQMPLWHRLIWPAVLDLVDRTGMPGPRQWQDGCYLPGEEEHPVVGVSWYEACAYARWLGKRLPSDAEWVKSGSWPVPLSATSREQRKYPWGDTIDRTRANVWGSGPGRIVPVGEFAKGVSVGGVYQLVGNVWEWTGGNFRSSDHPRGDLILPMPMKRIRGGAFDTYFDNQATCQFQSGENPLRRRHNIGFRCAVGVRDLALVHSAPSEVEQTAQQDCGEQDSAEQGAPAAEEAHA